MNGRKNDNWLVIARALSLGDERVQRILGGVVLRLGAQVFVVAFALGVLCGWWWF